MNKAILTVAAALSVCSMASAQHFDPEHRHSIEISAGIPPLHAQLGFDAHHLEDCYTLSQSWIYLLYI